MPKTFIYARMRVNTRTRIMQRYIDFDKWEPQILWGSKKLMNNIIHNSAVHESPKEPREIVNPVNFHSKRQNKHISHTKPLAQKCKLLTIRFHMFWQLMHRYAEQLVLVPHETLRGKLTLRKSFWFSCLHE